LYTLLFCAACAIYVFSVLTAVTETKVSKEAANRWTDNLFTLKSWLKKKFPVPENQINKQFGIPEDLDYIE